jgi:ureidoacrylate peracid hydrolase
MHKFEMPQSYIERVVARQGRVHTCEEFTPDRTALVVVDMQYYFMEDGQLAACPEAREIVPNVNRLAQAVRNAGGTVIWIQNLASDETARSWSVAQERYSPDKQKIRIESLRRGAHGHDFWHALDIHPDDERITKRRYSAFIQGSSNIEIVLDDNEIDTIVVTGVATNVCCESTARDAMMRNYRTVMVSDACATNTDAEHAAALGTFYLYFGDVQTTDQVAGQFEAKARNAPAPG